MPKPHLPPTTGPCEPDCPVAAAHDLLSGKWTTLIVRELLQGPRSYAQLQRGLGGISPRMLALRLSALTEAGLVHRTQFETIPPTTEYRLTELGQKALPVIAAMAEFGLAVQSHHAPV